MVFFKVRVFVLELVDFPHQVGVLAFHTRWYDPLRCVTDSASGFAGVVWVNTISLWRYLFTL